jgi:hypothetical protein
VLAFVGGRETVGPSAGEDGPTAFVAFVGRDRRFWTDWFNPRGFRHCCPFWFDPELERWVVLDSTHGGVSLITLRPDEFDRWLVVLQRSGARFLAIPRRRSPAFFFRLGLWCVPFTAHAIGARSRAWRPIGLWRDLLRQGATPAFQGFRRAEDQGPAGSAGKP